MEIRLKALTPIWTGDADRKNTTLRETGIIGSLRWWYEALIRGLGGTACDPSQTDCKDDIHCDACELFGCTGWARKFRLEVEKLNNNEINLRFIEIREMKDVEWALLNKTIEIIADYGAIGGKIAEPKQGIIQIEQNDLSKMTLKKEELNKYLKNKRNGVDNPTLSLFVFMNKNLKYKTIKNIKDNLSFLKGQKEKGKRYFYKTKDNKPFRFFAYAENNDEYSEIKKFLENESIKFIEGGKLLEDLK